MAEENEGSKSQIHTDIYTHGWLREVGDASSASPIKLAFSLGPANDSANLQLPAGGHCQSSYARRPLFIHALIGQGRITKHKDHRGGFLGGIAFNNRQPFWNCDITSISRPRHGAFLT